MFVMLKFVYKVSVHNWDYFDQFSVNPHQDEVYYFDSLSEAFAFYKEEKEYDKKSIPGDHTHTTHRPVRVVKFVNEPHVIHGYVRGHQLNCLYDVLEDKYRHYKKYNVADPDVTVSDIDDDDIQWFPPEKYEDDDIIF